MTNCKCAHEKIHHKESIFWNIGACDKCPCTHYMNQSKPDKKSHFFLAFGICGIVLMALITVGVISFFYNLPPEPLEKPLDLTVEDLLHGLILFFFLAMSYFAVTFFELFIEQYIRQKKRKDWN